jgi:hypothetical protein
MVPSAPERRRELMRNHRGEAVRWPRVWALLEAMAYAGAFIDPTGALALQRLRRTREGGNDG